MSESIKHVLMLTYDGGALYVYEDHIDIHSDDDYYNGTFDLTQMSALRDFLNILELPTNALR